MGRYYTSPPVATSKPVGIRNKAYVKKRNGVSRIVTDSYGRPSDWWDISKRVKKRDNYKCVFCGAPEKPKEGVYHEVHHLKRLADGGTTTMANLGTCCKRCHKRRPGHSHMHGKQHH